MLSDSCPQGCPVPLVRSRDGKEYCTHCKHTFIRETPKAAVKEMKSDGQKELDVTPAPAARPIAEKTMSSCIHDTEKPRASPLDKKPIPSQSYSDCEAITSVCRINCPSELCSDSVTPDRVSSAKKMLCAAQRSAFLE